MKWITRAHVHVDRVACPWLISRFVDSQAEFIFASANQVNERAEEENAIPFDIPGAKLGHRDGKCTFWAIIEEYGLKDPVLLKMAEIVNAADTGKLDAHPYAPGIEALARGFSIMFPDDEENLSFQFSVYDAMYAALKCEGAG